MTNDGQNTLVYDAENRATVTGSSSGTYTYDGNGLRVQKVSVIGNNSTTTVYIFSGSKVIAEYDNGAAVNSPSREYIYAGATLLAKIDSSGTKYYHQDHLSNRLITDSSGNTVGEQGHFPFGEQWYPTPPASPPTKWEFTTYERDSESGNDYAQARYNISRLGRFSSPDPIAGSIADPQSLNRYSYVRNMPVMLSDPSGMIPGTGGGCSTAENKAPDSPSSESDRTGGPSAADPSADPAPQARCGGGPPCAYTLAGCGGGSLDGVDMSGLPPGLLGTGVSNNVCPGGDCRLVNTGICNDRGLCVTVQTVDGMLEWVWPDGRVLSDAAAEEWDLPFIDPFAPTIAPTIGGTQGGEFERAINQARLMLSNDDCAKFLKSVLSNLGYAPNLDSFLKEFDYLKVISTPPGDAKNDPGYPGPGYVAHIAGGVGQSSTVHVDAPGAQDLVPTLLHETFHDTLYSTDDQHLAKAATGDSSYLSAKLKPASRAATRAFDKHCTPK